MTQFWHHPLLIVELLAHQSHFQSNFNAHQSKCVHNTTKLILKHNKFEHHTSYYQSHSVTLTCVDRDSYQSRLGLITL